MDVPVVSPLWVERCRELGEKIDEADFLILSSSAANKEEAKAVSSNNRVEEPVASKASSLQSVDSSFFCSSERKASKNPIETEPETVSLTRHSKRNQNSGNQPESEVSHSDPLRSTSIKRKFVKKPSLTTINEKIVDKLDDEKENNPEMRILSAVDSVPLPSFREAAQQIDYDMLPSKLKRRRSERISDLHSDSDSASNPDPEPEDSLADEESLCGMNAAGSGGAGGLSSRYFKAFSTRRKSGPSSSLSVPVAADVSSETAATDNGKRRPARGAQSRLASSTTLDSTNSGQAKESGAHELPLNPNAALKIVFFNNDDTELRGIAPQIHKSKQSDEGKPKISRARSKPGCQGEEKNLATDEDHPPVKKVSRQSLPTGSQGGKGKGSAVAEPVASREKVKKSSSSSEVETAKKARKVKQDDSSVGYFMLPIPSLF